MQNKETDMGYIWKVMCEVPVSNINKRKTKKIFTPKSVFIKLKPQNNVPHRREEHIISDSQKNLHSMQQKAGIDTLI